MTLCLQVEPKSDTDAVGLLGWANANDPSRWCNHDASLYWCIHPVDMVMVFVFVFVFAVGFS